MSVIYRRRTTSNPFYSHITPKETRDLFRKFGWDFDGYTKFVFVRNPWARLASLYEMIYKQQPSRPAFSEWLATIKPYGLGGGGEDWQRWRKYGTYSIEHFIKDDAGNVLVDKVMRLEDMHRDLKPFLKFLELPGVDDIEIPHINRREAARGYTRYYTSETVALVSDLYAYDIMNYDYTFGD